MKLESLSIRDFRGIESLDLSFKDDLDLIRDCVPIVGPNTSGKTSILDAIAISLLPMTDSFQLRPDETMGIPRPIEVPTNDRTRSGMFAQVTPA